MVHLIGLSHGAYMYTQKAGLYKISVGHIDVENQQNESWHM